MNKGDILEFNYTGRPQEVKLRPGIYKFEVWGAEGGGKRLSGISDSGDGGKGGYACGIISIFESRTLYAYIGGHGASTTNTIAEGGWNGGGCAWGSGSNEPGNSGGGATDFRLIGGEWDNEEGLLSRIIVAGGGGGGGEDNGETGGYGGGETGGSSYKGTQTSTSGGGAFGKGAHTPNDGGGGGGGWYGGGTTNGSQTRPTSNSTSDTSASASGGSGFVYKLGSLLPENYNVPTEFSFNNIVLSTGNMRIPTHNGEGTQVGNAGNGFAKITCIETMKIPLFFKTNGAWVRADGGSTIINNELINLF